MKQNGSDMDAFARLVETLSPWLEQVVFVGGWAHRLYRLHPLAQALDRTPLMTRDADVAVPAPRPRLAGNISDRLLAAGFQEEFSGDFRPPVTRYRLGAEYGGFYAEFVTPLRGSLAKRDGRADATTTIAGVTAQKLRHLDLLMVAPWQVTPGKSSGFALTAPTSVRIPNAASYFTQKILIHSNRPPAQRAKDLLYIHETIELFGSSLAEVRREWRRHVKPELAARARRAVEAFASEKFNVISDEVRVAAREATAASGRSLSPESLAEVCRGGLGAVFLDAG